MVKQEEFTAEELGHLRKAVALAAEALEAGDSPFGSVLVSRTGEVLQTDRNRIYTGSPDDPEHHPDASLHPEFTLAKWAQRNMTPEERAGATVYTSGEHCPMCAALHAYVGLGPIVYVTSCDQFFQWMEDYGVDVGGVSPLEIGLVARKVPTRGPVEGLYDEVKALMVKRWTKQGYTLKA
jgi:tRNA(Arg) A34 adenosine deaminase TadA